MRGLALVSALVLLFAVSGCVTRRVVIKSDPPGAMVYQNGQPIGPTPIEIPFVYYGTYHFRLVRDGCEPVDYYPELVAPWYQWPGIDFVTENLLPFQFRDKQTFEFKLPDPQPVQHDAIRARATELQERGATIVPPPGAQPRPRQPNGPVSAPAGVFPPTP
jgi:hypothetical protein